MTRCLGPTSSATDPATLIRFVAVGACNTVFGYGCFAFFTMLLMPLVAYGYVVASLLSNLVAITFSFLGYKWFVFKTHGHYLKEWIRCGGVYAGSTLLSAAALPVLVPVVRRQTGNARTAPTSQAQSCPSFPLSSAFLVIATFPLPNQDRHPTSLAN